MLDNMLLCHTNKDMLAKLYQVPTRENLWQFNLSLAFYVGCGSRGLLKTIHKDTVDLMENMYLDAFLMDGPDWTSLN